LWVRNDVVHVTVSHHRYPSHPTQDTSLPWRAGALTVSLPPIEWLIVVFSLIVLTAMDIDINYRTANTLEIL
jgi:hypothetical protein